MFARSSSSLLAFLLVALASTLQVAQAAMAQGDMNFTRDWIIKVTFPHRFQSLLSSWTDIGVVIVQYDQTSYTSTEVFCKRFRSACVDYVGPLNQHHQLDCVFNNGKVTQKGVRSPLLPRISLSFFEKADSRYIGSYSQRFMRFVVDYLRTQMVRGQTMIRK